jgi:hypothetical protein
LFRYLDEENFRFNERKHDDAEGTIKTDAERFIQVLGRIAGKRLTYAHLTGNDGQVLPTEIQP